MPSAQAIDYVQCEAIQRAAARLKSAMDAEALAAQNAIILPAMEKAQAICMKNFVNNEILNCMNIRMANYEADGVLAREVIAGVFVSKTYLVEVDKMVTQNDLDRLNGPCKFLTDVIRPIRVRLLAPTLLEFVLREGKNIKPVIQEK